MRISDWSSDVCSSDLQERNVMEGRRFDVTDMHTAGEPVRIVTGGYPELSGASILEKRREAMRLHDDIRRILVLEPRGHSGMYGVIPVRPTDPRAALAARSEEHTSELQSLMRISYAVFCLKKKKEFNRHFIH